MFFKPGKMPQVLRTDPRGQLRIHAHAPSQTTDKLRPSSTGASTALRLQAMRQLALRQA